MFWCQLMLYWKVSQFWKKWGSHKCFLKMNGLYVISTFHSEVCEFFEFLWRSVLPGMDWNQLIWLNPGFQYVLRINDLGWAQWNLSSFEFIFDDTRLSSWYKNKIGPIESFLCCVLTLLSLCPVGCLGLAFLNWANRAT